MSALPCGSDSVVSIQDKVSEVEIVKDPRFFKTEGHLGVRADFLDHDPLVADTKSVRFFCIDNFAEAKPREGEAWTAKVVWSNVLRGKNALTKDERTKVFVHIELVARVEQPRRVVLDGFEPNFRLRREVWSGMRQLRIEEHPATARDAKYRLGNYAIVEVREYTGGDLIYYSPASRIKRKSEYMNELRTLFSKFEATTLEKMFQVLPQAEGELLAMCQRRMF